MAAAEGHPRFCLMENSGTPTGCRINFSCYKPQKEALKHRHQWLATGASHASNRNVMQKTSDVKYLQCLLSTITAASVDSSQLACCWSFSESTQDSSACVSQQAGGRQQLQQLTTAKVTAAPSTERRKVVVLFHPTYKNKSGYFSSGSHTAWCVWSSSRSF